MLNLLERLTHSFRAIVTLFSLFAEIKRALISLRTKEARATAKAAGKHLGRPRGRRGRSKLDRDIKRLLTLQVSKASIVKITGIAGQETCHSRQGGA